MQSASDTPSSHLRECCEASAERSDGVAKRHGRTTAWTQEVGRRRKLKPRAAGALKVVALASRFWGLGCPKIYHDRVELNSDPWDRNGGCETGYCYPVGEGR